VPGSASRGATCDGGISDGIGNRYPGPRGPRHGIAGESSACEAGIVAAYYHAPDIKKETRANRPGLQSRLLGEALACCGELSSKPSYIIPPMSGMPPPAIAGSFSGGSATIASVVRMFLAIEAAFCSAERVTIAGSMTPAAVRSP
jgi:hypothetical protein